ncbi:hypothetical protein [Streptomyces aurantiogriseus]|uniref:Dynamin family protein n=1 Tax=Streptomyces aurantiogriseus TaxID=66870 RepID=A0A918FJW3_9ACTN|nr:hypothetical protein [Streptomyces aurantiogriseus]GGR39996.1 hypothetical protein GCM10010251_65850 [Streptomyces aurantiogriseus]
MSEISRAIDALLEARLRQLPAVERESARWKTLGERLDELDTALTDLRLHTTLDPDLAASLTVPQLPEMRAGVAEAADSFRTIASRFTRTTVNLGVSGAARMGKSTLLQSVSGLDDQQIPTGDGIPVTAVRSRIFHSPTVRRAELEMHSPESFLTEVIAPLHTALALATPPRSLTDFAAWNYPKPTEDTRRRMLFARLRDLQSALPSYEHLLTGGVTSVPLEEIRPYVAYPTSEEVEAAGPGGVRRLYAAVREARIECPFPHEHVARIGIVDLPGLGEVTADAEQRHVDGLRNEVDAVLVVKRSSETSSFIDETDTAGMALLDRVRGYVRSTGEFTYVVHNVDPDKPHLAEALRGQLLHSLNDGEADRFFTVFEADVRDPEQVGREVLTPLLTRLADGLPVMDAEVLSGTRGRAAAVRDRIRLHLTDVRRVLDQVGRRAGVPEEVNDAKADQLRSGVAKRLRVLVAELAAEANHSADPGFVQAVESAYQGVLDWIDDGFGRGAQTWQELALTRMITEGHPADFAGPEFNRIRVEISRRFAALDDFFTERITDAWDRAAAAVAAECGALFSEQAGSEEADEKAGGRAVLSRLAELFEDSPQPCPGLAAAVHNLLDVRLEYRTLLYPRVRPDLAPLNLQVTHPDTGEEMQHVAVPLTEEGAKELYGIFNGLAEQAAFRIQKSLLREAAVPAAVVHALLEQFEDTLIRSGTSAQEFRRFVRSYRNDLWPEEFRGIDEANSRFARVVRVTKEIAALTEREDIAEREEEEL